MKNKYLKILIVIAIALALVMAGVILVKESGLEETVFFVGRVDAAEADRYVHFADCAYLSFKNNKIFNEFIT